jgi:hypothetical protein
MKHLLSTRRCFCIFPSEYFFIKNARQYFIFLQIETKECDRICRFESTCINRIINKHKLCINRTLHKVPMQE